MNAIHLARRARSIGLLLLLLSFALPERTASSNAPVADGRVVVLGFDGADARTVERMMGEGQLPNLSKLAASGTFQPLHSTNPAESAAGWAALNTGTNPLKNNVPSFIKRHESGSVFPGFGHLRTETVRVEDLDPAGLLGIYQSYEGWQVATAVAGGVVVLFFALFKLLLRANVVLSAVLSVVLGGAGAYATLQPADQVPEQVPNVYLNNVDQKGFWDYAAEKGKRSMILDAALAFGRPETPGARVLAGLGLPDVRGAGNGNWFIYTTDDLEMYRPPQGYTISRGGKSGTGTIFRVDETGGKVETKVYGPVNFTKQAPLEAALADVTAKLSAKGLGWKESGKLRDEKGKLEAQLKAFDEEPWEHRTELPLVMERKGTEVEITIGDQTHSAGEGEWTGWFRLPFRLNRLVEAGGITRARVMSLQDPLTVYFHSFDIDPQNPPFWQPVSSPREFSAQLVKWTGDSFETLGWSCMTNQLKDDALPVDVFLEDIEFTMQWRERLAYACLDRKDWELLFAVFSTPDRVQHMMYKYHDPEHPLHDPVEAARTVEFFGHPTALKDVIPEIYKQVDRVVGKVLSKLKPNDHLFLCADHGFTSYRYGLEVNNWLAREGYIVFSEPSEKGSKTLGEVVDWSQTRAYSLGLGMIYVNMEDREPAGIVPKSEAKALLEEIGDKLVALTDPGPEDAPFSSPRSVVRDYAIMDDLYAGGSIEWGDPTWPCADMQIGLDEFYRVSWGTVSGKMRFAEDEYGDVVLGPVFRDNSNNWSGDHASNSPGLVTGIFFSRKPIEVPANGVNVMHLAPTILDALDVSVPAHMDMPPLGFE